MDTSTMMNALTTQHYECYANTQMNVSTIANVVTMKRHSCYSGILINTSVMLNALIAQRCRRCTFDSPGLPNDSAGYPGLGYVVWGTTPSVLRFF